MEYLVSKEEQEQIEKTIEEFEDKSSAEIVTVIAKQSDPYMYIPTLFAAIIALLVPWLFPIGAQTGLIQLVLFMFLVLLFQLKAVKMFIVPAVIKKKRASNNAKNKFLELLAQDTQRDGLVMLYVSEAEKYVEIITDSIVAQKIDDSAWDEAVENFIKCVKDGEIAKGYIETIKNTSELLIENFPQTEDDKDVMPNHLILI